MAGLDPSIILAGNPQPNPAQQFMSLYEFAQKAKQAQAQQQQTNQLRNLFAQPDATDPKSGLPTASTIARAYQINPDLGTKIAEGAAAAQEKRAQASRYQGQEETAIRGRLTGALTGATKILDETGDIDQAKQAFYDAVDGEQISDEDKARRKAPVIGMDATQFRHAVLMAQASQAGAAASKPGADKTDLKEYTDSTGTTFFKDIHSPGRNLTAAGEPYEPVGEIKPVPTSGEQGSLTPKAVAYYAEQFRTYGPTALGRLSKTDRDAVINAAAEEGDATGDIQTQLAQKGAQAEQRAEGTRRGQLRLGEAEMEGAVKLSQQAYSKLSRDQIVPFNQLRIMYEKGTSNPEQAAAYAADNALVNIYARMISPTGQGTDSDKNHAREMLNQAQGPEAHQAVVNQLLAEGRNAMAGGERAGRETTEQTPIARHAPPPPKTAGSNWDAAIKYLRLHPDSKGDFDKRYGPGTADSVLGGQ